MDYCQRSSMYWDFEGDNLWVLHPDGWRHFARVPGSSPDFQVLYSAFDEMVRLAELPCAPHLEFVHSARSAGGFYVDGLVVVGINDSRVIANRIWRKHYPAIIKHVAEMHLRRGVTPVDYRVFLHVAVMGRIIAHELGHAIFAMTNASRPFDNEEANADVFAGWIDAQRGKDYLLGSLIFESIGCEALLCTHPSPAGRAYAYRLGYAEMQTTAR